MPTLREQFAVLWEQLRPEWAALLVLGLTVVGGAAASLAGPILLSHYIDAAQAGVVTGVTLAAGLYILTATALPALSVVENWLATVVAWRSTNRIRVRLFRHCLDQDLELLERHPPGALITRIDGDVEMLSEFLSTFVVRLFTAALVLAGVIVVMARLDWRLGALLAFFVVLSVLALNGARSFAQRLWHAQRRASAEELGTLEELLSGTEDIRANGATAWAVARYLGRGWTSYVAYRRAQILASSSWAVTVLLYGWATAASLALATGLHDRHLLTVGAVYLVFSYAEAIRAPLDAVNRQLQLLQTAGAALARIRELLAERPRIAWPAAPVAVGAGAPEVVLDSVDFTYPGAAETLRDVSFRLAPGQLSGAKTQSGRAGPISVKKRMQLNATTGATSVDGSSDCAFVSGRNRLTRSRPAASTAAASWLQAAREYSLMRP